VLGGAVGIALLSTLAASATTSYLRHHAAITPALQQHAAVHGYTTAYWTATAIFTAGALLTALLYRTPPTRRPHQHRPRLTTAPPQLPWSTGLSQAPGLGCQRTALTRTRLLDVRSQEQASELPVGRCRVVAVGGEGLDRDVVCPGVQMGAEAGRDDIGGAVEHERVD